MRFIYKGKHRIKRAESEVIDLPERIETIDVSETLTDIDEALEGAK